MSAICRCVFEHIRSGEPCPLTGQYISKLQQDFESRFHLNQDNISPLLAQVLDDVHGTEEMVKIRRKVKSIEEYTRYYPDGWKRVTLGSRGDGFLMPGLDFDVLTIKTTVVVTYPDQLHLLPRNSSDKTILLMRPAGLRPGYVSLEVVQIANGAGKSYPFQYAIVPIGRSLFLSSDMFRQKVVDLMSVFDPRHCVSNGPCCTLQCKSHRHDNTFAFPIVCWPREAHEWIHRPRLYGWPAQTMIDKIIQGGCHVVPVGDKCSTDTLLQWRTSFACAEQMLVHSLTHPQFRVYGLLKHFLSQIKELLGHLLGDDDILCSYFLKTIIFHAVENSPQLLWDRKNTFLCFRFCLAILIACVRSGYCPNYFIPTNNMFLRKVHGKTRQKLLHFLIDLYDLKLISLFVKSVGVNYIGSKLQNEELHSRLRSECFRDITLFSYLSTHFYVPVRRSLYRLMKCLKVAHTDIDVFIAFRALASALCITVVRLLNESDSNKQKYVVLKKCSTLLKLQEPGFLLLASFYYLSGCYRKTLRLCSEMMSTYRLFIGDQMPFIDDQFFEPYERLYCGKEYTLWQKFKEGVYFPVYFNKENIMLCPPHLHTEVTKMPRVDIPPLPYAIFLSFLCYHELGDLRRRDTELVNLRAANYDPYQGGHRFWIVHTILGICYQTVGDKRRAIRSFTDSLRVKPDGNPAKDRIEALRNSR